MAELVRIGVREQIGASDPAAQAPGAVVRVLDLAGQFLTSAAEDLAPNTRAGVDPYRMWLAPDLTLVVHETQQGPPPGTFVSDVTDGLVVFEITGTRAGEIIAMSTTLDPTGVVLATGRCAQTLFGGVKLVLYAHDDGFRLHAERQFAAFLLDWLVRAVSALAAPTPKESHS